jgi:predicted phage baseplate assembly protein
VEGRIDDGRYWLRVRLAERTYPAGQEPEIDFLLPNVARVRNLATERNEVVGVSDGQPEQSFSLAFQPVAPGSLLLEVEDPEQNGEYTAWKQVDDLLASGPEDEHFVLNAVAGEITFGDGHRSLIPPAGSQIVARRYQRGGGEAGNVGAGMINLPLTALTGIAEVSNPRAAAGGRNEESIDDFLTCAPRRLRHRGRAVAADDFARMAEDVGGIGMAKAIPLLHLGYPGVDVPGAVTVVIVPYNLEVKPQPTPAEIEAVCRYLATRRLLTTELHVKGPEYITVRVQATVQVAPYASFDTVAGEIIRAINTSLDPLQRDWLLVEQNGASGAQKEENDNRAAACKVALGGEVGRDLYPTSLYSVIQSVEHVRAISYLAVNGQEYDELRIPIEVPRDGLLVGSAEHKIEVEPYVEER